MLRILRFKQKNGFLIKKGVIAFHFQLAFQLLPINKNQ